ncbi:DUF262 domain-containing protein [Elusimicrobiota bacterium]
MLKDNFSAETKNFKELFLLDNIYKIPKFQRDYSWDNSNFEWEDLWKDIISKDSDKHYIGFIVLKSESKKTKELEVIDGQQRLATITIIILAALELLKEFIQNNKDKSKQMIEKERLQDLARDYIGRKDPTSRTLYNKLILNETNGNFFKNLCTNKTEFNELQIPHLDSKNKSNKKIQKAFDYFKNNIEKKLFNLNGGKISVFIENMTQKLFFTVLYVSSDINAYTLFETLNSRGMKLASVDLLKNFLYSKASHKKNYILAMEQNWNDIISNVKEGELNKFIRTDWGTRNNLVEDRKLFKVISKSITNDKSVFKYIGELKDSSGLFSLLQNPDDSYWNQNGYNSDVSLHLKNLNILQLKQVYGILIAYLKNMEKRKFHILLSWLEKISVRFNTISGSDAKEQEYIYNDISMKISAKKIKSLEDIKKILKKIYMPKDSFITNFANAEIKRTQTIKYLFNKINIQMQGGPLDINSLTVEHILAQNKNGDWTSYEDAEEYIWKLGNLTLLEKETNRKLNNKIFAKKIPIYSNIQMPIVQNIIPNSINKTWTKESIEKRQKELANLAQDIWGIPDFE